MTQEERKRSDSKRNYLKQQVPGNRHKSSGGSILIQGMMWIGESGERQWTSDAPSICLLTLESISKTKKLGKKGKKGRDVKAMPRNEMTAAQENEADILQIDSLMYIPVDWGESDSPSNKRRRGQVVSMRHRMKPRVQEHFKGLIKSPETMSWKIYLQLGLKMFSDQALLSS
jgi:hypothetical protein